MIKQLLTVSLFRFLRLDVFEYVYSMRNRRKNRIHHDTISSKELLHDDDVVDDDGSSSNHALLRFRFWLGIAEFVQIVRMLYYETIQEYFEFSEFHFKYYGFEWVPVLKAPYLYIQYGLSAFVCLIFASGQARVFGSVSFFLSQSWFFLSDRALYNNHYYLAVLFSILFLHIDIHKSWFVVKRLYSDVYLFLFQMQIGIVYAFATFAKLSSPDWLKAYPARIWLQNAFKDAVKDVYGPQWIVRYICSSSLSVSSLSYLLPLNISRYVRIILFLFQWLLSCHMAVYL